MGDCGDPDLNRQLLKKDRVGETAHKALARTTRTMKWKMPWRPLDAGDGRLYLLDKRCSKAFSLTLVMGIRGFKFALGGGVNDDDFHRWPLNSAKISAADRPTADPPSI